MFSTHPRGSQEAPVPEDMSHVGNENTVSSPKTTRAALRTSPTATTASPHAKKANIRSRNKGRTTASRQTSKRVSRVSRSRSSFRVDRLFAGIVVTGLDGLHPADAISNQLHQESISRKISATNNNKSTKPAEKSTKPAENDLSASRSSALQSTQRRSHSLSMGTSSSSSVDTKVSPPSSGQSVFAADIKHQKGSYEIKDAQLREKNLNKGKVEYGAGPGRRWFFE